LENKIESEKIRLRLHHITMLYELLCLSLAEQARTLLFNHERVYGKDYAVRVDDFFQRIIDSPDDRVVSIVGGLDDICLMGCPKRKESCEEEDEQKHYDIPKKLDIRVGDEIEIGKLKTRLKKFMESMMLVLKIIIGRKE